MTKDPANAAAFLDYAERYFNAFGDIETSADRLPPRMQLIGQAVELALKAFLAATRGTWPTSHSLTALCDCCEIHGLALCDGHRDDVLAKLSSVYHRGPGGSTWRYPTRYPNAELNVWVTPSNGNLRSLFESIVEQTKRVM